MPLDCTTVSSENNQSNEKFRDFNFSLKPVTVADETKMSGREFQTLMMLSEKKWPSWTKAV